MPNKYNNNLNNIQYSIYLTLVLVNINNVVRLTKPLIAVLLIIDSCLIQAKTVTTYELWDDKPAPNSYFEGVNSNKGQGKFRYPIDNDWEHYSYPLGNGFMGINVFGRTDTDRIQLTEKSFYNNGSFDAGGLTNFAEVLLDFNHDAPKHYRRSLNLENAISYVEYQNEGVQYKREYFVSYPDQVAVIHLTAETNNKLNLTIRPDIPYLNSKMPADKRTGTVVTTNNTIRLFGSMAFSNINYEAQIKVLNKGGSLTAGNNNGKGNIQVANANEITIIIAADTNYRLQPETFLNSNQHKLDKNEYPHDKVSATIKSAATKGFSALKSTHLKDYSNLFSRVSVNFSPPRKDIKTEELLNQYKQGKQDTYLEELMFHYGRYLLISSSREETLPSGLQGAWSHYERTPWTGGYWHNINIQMNYWGAMSLDLSETFEAYIKLFKAYLSKAQTLADDYVKEHNPHKLTAPGTNGWIVGTAVNPYSVGKPGGHSGPGTGGLTSKFFIEYFNFTQDEEFLRETGYPALLGMSQFYDKALKPFGDDLLLVEPSASPEQMVKKTPDQIDKKSGKKIKKVYYITVGATFDQASVWENHSDLLKAAKVLNKKSPFLDTVRDQMTKLDPILIGSSGQIKEYREESEYGEIGEYHHRHISHLVALYPGTLINSGQPEWMKAASKTLDFRGHKTTGWAMAHRMNARARLKEGDKAHEIFQSFIAKKTVPNLWTLHPPFQIDGNFGVMAGVSEMLLQSHEGIIDILPALPKAWQTGAFNGLVARGNFTVSATWKNGKATELHITSRSGGICQLRYTELSKYQVKDSTGKSVNSSKVNKNIIQINTQKGQRYSIIL